MSFLRLILTLFIRFCVWALCRVEFGDELSKLPRRGPYILAANHINFMDIPLVYTSLYPRPLIGMAKKETWDNPLIGTLLNIWGAMPVDREHADLGAMKGAAQVLKRGKILVMTPEGTRSGDGRLRKGRAGAIAIAVHAGVPIIPVAHFGLERFWGNLRRLRRTRVGVRVGEPLRVELGEAKLSHNLRSELATELMLEISALLPPKYRGYYADPPPETLSRPHLVRIPQNPSPVVS